MIALTSLLRKISIFFLASSSILAVDFERDLAPILETKCLSCHNPNKQEGDLSLASEADILAFEDELIVAGNAFDSLLHQIVLPFDDGEAPEMPEKGDPLTEEEAALLAEWIDSGASWPEGLVLKEASKADKSWWAYQPVQSAKPLAIPAAAPQSWRSNPIDSFVYAQLEANALEPNPPADRRTLIRRATYDLTGLPPKPEAVEAFVRDPDPHAFEKLVDRLLESPQYGERWGRHWLDVVRFGESTGYEQNLIIDNAWPFRDYVIRSLNEDKAFDRFIREHLAGDVFGAGDPEVEIGSAFLVSGPYDKVNNQDPVQAAQIRANTLDEIINASGEAFLGMTLACARCHDHKFDPISSEDYYGMYATFSGVRHGARTLASSEETTQRKTLLAPLNRRKGALEKERKALIQTVMARARGNSAMHEARWPRQSVDRTGTEERFDPVTARFVRLVSEAQDINLNNSKSFRIDEFEVWSAESVSVNVALASNGARASGSARVIEDFPGAYGPHLTIDGKTDRQFISEGPNLTIELARPARIDRVNFSSARGKLSPENSRFAFVAEYRIEVSDDGETWQEVAHGRDRQPVNEKHRDLRLRRQEIAQEEVSRLSGLDRGIKALDREINSLPKLPEVWVGTRSEKDAEGPFNVFLGGNPQKRGQAAPPASISTLSEALPAYALAEDSEESQRRLELAEWITHSENPLPPRVLANRIWQYHFGTGIVDTPNDFGYMGGQPTHPELLDFLATRLKADGWRLKPLHRLVMTSQAYRQSSVWRQDAAAADSDARLLWRFPPRRLSAEEVRDTMLQVSGKLNLEMGGPGFRLYHYTRDNVATYFPLDEYGPETYRRSVYHQNARASRIDLMSEFDQPDCAFSTPDRSETTSPLQALTLLNHSFMLDMAQALAARIEETENESASVAKAFELAYQRSPDAAEQARSEALVDSHGLRAFCRALLNSSELIYLD